MLPFLLPQQKGHNKYCHDDMISRAYAVCLISPQYNKDLDSPAHLNEK